MKLIECYIENFGKLSSCSHTFSDGLNVINADNGYGKTTLSVFIKSMLYGIDARKLRGEESDRKRYMPWQGGRFGGSLTFENKGKLYRIERSFGDKASGDIFAIYDTESGSLSRDYSENVGEELFGIDADGFERTVFLSEKKLSVNGSNQTVAAKLSNLVGVDGDMGSFDKALEKLEKKEKYYQHRRGKGGIIGDIKSDISRLDSEIIALDAKKAECLAAEKKIFEIQKKLTEAKNKKSELEKKKNALEYEKEYRIHLVIHYDPIVTDDERVSALRDAVREAVQGIDERLGIHDFRFVEGKTHSNLKRSISEKKRLCLNVKKKLPR